jgi:hypothetical protein
MDHNDHHTLLLGRVEGKLDAVIARFDRVDRRIDEVEDQIGAVLDRVSVLENWRWYMLGLGAAASIVLPYIDITKIFGG